MASQKEIGETYNYMDEMFRLQGAQHALSQDGNASFL